MSYIAIALAMLLSLCFVLTWLITVMIAGGYKTLGAWAKGTSELPDTKDPPKLKLL